MSIKSRLLKFFRNSRVPGVRFIVRSLLILPRIKIASGYLLPNLSLAFKWLGKSREVSNFSYDLNGTNKLYLANLVSVVTGESLARIRQYMKELDDNKDLRNHITSGMDESGDSFWSGPFVGYGRRIGWYAIVRAVKPKIVVETGVDQGMGSCIIAEALSRNSKDGKKGKYYGTDIVTSAGSLFTGKYKNFGEILYGDSIKSLKKLGGKIDIFINDSDHSPEYEAKEYQTIQKLLTDKSIILGDNSHGSPELCKFAEKTKRKFLFFKEQPKNHWYEGGRIGIAYKST